MASSGAEIASAYVALTIKAPGIKRDITKELGGVDMPGIGQRMGSKLGEGLKKSLKVAGAAAGGVLIAGIGVALTKGFSRLNSLDQATAKLKGLGNSAATVDEIMKNALASVKGTAFGLDAAATTAAGAVAAGIKPGKELEGVLKSVANSAAAAGVPMEEFGAIFNKVASLGKAQNDVLQQVADRGLPIYQALADQMGVTTDEVFKMASAGKIGFKEFEQAMTSAAGNVAAELGNTVQGSWANFMASLGRIGAGFLGGAWSHVAPVLQAVTGAMGPLEEVAGKLGDKFGEWLAPKVESFIKSLEGFDPASIVTPFTAIFEAVKPAIPALAEAAGVIGGALGKALKQLGAVLADVAPELAGAFADAIVELAPSLVDLLKALVPLVPPMVQLLEAVLPLAVTLLDMLIPAISWLAGVIGDLTNLSVLGTDLRDGATSASQFAAGVSEIGGPIANFVISLMQTGVKLTLFVQDVARGAAAIVGAIRGAYNNHIRPVLAAIGAAFQWVWNTFIRPIVDAIKASLNALGAVFRWLYANVVQPVWNSIGGAIRTAWNVIKGVLDTMNRVVRTDPKKAFEAARDAIGTAWRGIQELAKKPVKFVIETVINGLIGTINKIPGVNIPKVPLPKGFSEGGYTGNLAPSAVAGVVHGDEHVIRSASRRSIEARHPGLLDHMNRYGTVPGYRKGGLVNPLPKGSYSVSQPYHGGHNGIDLAAASGTKVYAAGSGTVGLAGMVNMGGNEVYIQHENGLGTRYSHLSRFASRAGQKVRAGQVIGYVGSTGMSTGPHLHYMVHSPGGGGGMYGNHVNPAPYLGVYGKDLGEAGNPLEGLIDWVASKIKKQFPEGGMWVDAAAGIAKDTASKAVKHFTSFLGMDDTGATLYDRGGWLQPGTSLVQNKTGKPEPILTTSQWADMRAAASNGGGFSGPLVVRIGDREFEGWIDDRADGRIRVAGAAGAARANEVLGV